jgi:hypothetical protein
MKSQGLDKRYHHNIKLARYCDSKIFGLSVSVSRSGSFRDALSSEVDKVAEQVFRNHG